MLEGRAESAISFGFYKVRDEGFPPFSGGFCGITFGIFTHTEVRVVFLFFVFFFFFFVFFLNNITRITFTIGTDRSMYKAERENTC